MSTQNSRDGRGRAISPIIATVLIVAVTLIASLAVSGFVFGVFGESENTAQVAITGNALLAANFLSGGATKTFTCATNPAGSYLTLTNTGSSGASVTGITITWAGGQTAYTVSGTCRIGASGSATATTYVIFPATTQITSSAVTLQAYTGTVALSNGAQLLLTGTWQ
jgi:flagellin-like protein